MQDVDSLNPDMQTLVQLQIVWSALFPVLHWSIAAIRVILRMTTVIRFGLILGHSDSIDESAHTY